VALKESGKLTILTAEKTGEMAGRIGQGRAIMCQLTLIIRPFKNQYTEFMVQIKKEFVFGILD